MLAACSLATTGHQRFADCGPRPLMDVDLLRFLDPWTGADGLICAKRYATVELSSAWGMLSRRPQGNTLYGYDFSSV